MFTLRTVRDNLSTRNVKIKMDHEVGKWVVWHANDAPWGKTARECEDLEEAYHEGLKMNPAHVNRPHLNGSRGIRTWHAA